MALYSKRISLMLLLLLLLNLTELSITPHTPFSSSEVVHGQLRKKAARCRKLRRGEDLQLAQRRLFLVSSLFRVEG